MQHILDLVRPFWPLILALIVWPIVGAALSWWLWWDTPEHWDAYAKAHPGRAFIVRAIRTVSPHLRKLVVAWREYAAARSSLPPLGIALPAEKTGALVVSETRGFTSARNAYELDHPQPARPTPADGVAFDAQRRTLGAVTVDPHAGEEPFDPHARQTVVPPMRDDGQRGSVDVPGLVTCIVAAILAGALLYGCPRNPPVSGCQPEAQTCINDRPHVCSASQRWHVAGNLQCSAIGGVCTVLGGRAYCGPVADAGSPADAAVIAPDDAPTITAKISAAVAASSASLRAAAGRTNEAIEAVGAMRGESESGR